MSSMNSSFLSYPLNIRNWPFPLDRKITKAVLAHSSNWGQHSIKGQLWDSDFGIAGLQPVNNFNHFFSTCKERQLLRTASCGGGARLFNGHKKTRDGKMVIFGSRTIISSFLPKIQSHFKKCNYNTWSHLVRSPRHPPARQTWDCWEIRGLWGTPAQAWKKLDWRPFSKVSNIWEAKHSERLVAVIILKMSSCFK